MFEELLERVISFIKERESDKKCNFLKSETVRNFAIFYDRTKL
jgi:hypothetical protein